MKKAISFLTLFLTILHISAQQGGYSTIDKGRQVTFVRNTFNDNWFTGAGVGANSMFADHSRDASFKKTLTMRYSVFLGKWFNPFLGARLGLDAGPLHTFNEGATEMKHMEYANVHVDFTFNATNFFLNYNSSRVYNIIPFVGIGYGHTFKDGWKGWQNNSPSFNAGILNTFRFSNKFSAYIELNGMMVDDEFGGVWGGDWHWEGMGSVTAGLLMHFGGKTYFEECIPCRTGQLEELNNQINNLRSQVNILSQRPQECPECPKPQPPAKVEIIKREFKPQPVFFKINSPVIQEDQNFKIEDVAKYMKENPDAKVQIAGYADVKTGNYTINQRLSEQRVKNVANRLVEQYNIDRNRISIDWKGDTVQPYMVNELNRAAIFILIE